MNKYIATIDYMAGEKKSFDFYDLAAKNLLDAMSEAGQYFGENVYMVRIAEKSSSVFKEEYGKRVEYTEILSHRCHDWHPCDAAHSETPHTWNKYIGKNYIDFGMK